MYYINKMTRRETMITIQLRALLERRNMTQAELAKLTGIRPSTICDLCNNNAAFIKIEHLERILIALKCRLSDVLVYEQ